MKQKIVKTKSNVKNIKLPTIENETHKSIIKEIDHFQNIISSIGYNSAAEAHFVINKKRSYYSIIGLANRIYESKLPIKCLEAVVLAMKLTNHINDLKRFTITFHSVCEGKKYKHIVLGVHVGNRYGAIGLSRRDSLMYKPVIYRKFSQLIKNYSNSYLEHEHALVYVGVGLPIPHDIYSCQKLIWKYIIFESNLNINSNLCVLIEEYESRLSKINGCIPSISYFDPNFKNGAKYKKRKETQSNSLSINGSNIKSLKNKNFIIKNIKKANTTLKRINSSNSRVKISKNSKNSKILKILPISHVRQFTQISNISNPNCISLNINSINLNPEKVGKNDENIYPDSLKIFKDNRV